MALNQPDFLLPIELMKDSSNPLPGSAIENLLPILGNKDYMVLAFPPDVGYSDTLALIPPEERLQGLSKGGIIPRIGIAYSSLTRIASGLLTDVTQRDIRLN